MKEVISNFFSEQNIVDNVRSSMVFGSLDLPITGTFIETCSGEDQDVHVIFRIAQIVTFAIFLGLVCIKLG